MRYTVDMQPTNKIRFDQFSDGVFAIAVTLLALELRVPYLQTPLPGFSLASLRPLVPGLLTFVLSFIAIAIFWVNQHQLTQNLVTISRRRILWLNILLLLFITLIPFVTQTMSLNVGAALGVSMYAFVLFAASVSFSLLRYWIHKEAGDHHIVMTRSILGPAVYFLALLAPFFSIPLAYGLLLIPPLFYFLPKGGSLDL
jgi:uncharacterized membrane protein